MSGNTPCIRCGKMRIVAKSWTGNIGSSIITYTLTVCPDPACQKIVEAELQEKQDKVRAIQERSLERKKIIKRARKIKRE